MLAPTARLPAIRSTDVPAISAAQMAEVDRLAVEVFGITLLQMMAQAGSHLADIAAVEIGGGLRGSRVVVAAGPGNNGAGGLEAARHLVNRGADVRVVLARPARRLSEAGRRQLATLLEMGVPCCVVGYDIADAELARELGSADLVIDAVLGYRGRGAPHDEVKLLLDHIAGAVDRVLSLDLPSGTDADSGEAPPGAWRARATMTLALPKAGLLTDAGQARAGRLYLVDIGLPAALYARIGLIVDAPFAPGRILRLEDPR